MIVGGPLYTHPCSDAACVWAKRNAVDCEVWRPDWRTHGKSAAFVRSREMLASEPDLMIAFPGGSGTEFEVKEAKRLGIPIRDEGGLR